MTDKLTFTLKNHNDPVEKITYSLTVRDGWNADILRQVTTHYFEAVKTLREGKRTIENTWFGALFGVYDADLELVQIWGELEIKTPTGPFKFSCNRFNEHMTAQQLVNEAWAFYDALQALEMERLLDKAQVGEREATLQVDTPYPVPTIVERAMTRQRHNPFVPTQEQKMRQAMEDIEYSDYQGDDIHEYAD